MSPLALDHEQRAPGGQKSADYIAPDMKHSLVDEDPGRAAEREEPRRAGVEAGSGGRVLIHHLGPRGRDLAAAGPIHRGSQ